MLAQHRYASSNAGGASHPVMSGRRLQAIHGFRETERSAWWPQNEAVLARVRARALPPGGAPLPYAHVLDLAPAGHIKPHVDAVRVRPVPSRPTRFPNLSTAHK